MGYIEGKGGNTKEKCIFAKIKGTPIKTFKKYAHHDISKRRKIGGKVGRSSIASDSKCELIIQHTIHTGRANYGLSRMEIAENLQDLEHTLSRIQAIIFTRRTMKKRAEGRLKPRSAKARR